METSLDQLLARGQQAGPGQLLLTAPEAERMVEGLQMFQVEDVGSAKFMAQHDWIEKLNLQAHLNAQSHSDEFVASFLSSYDKMQLLVHDLLVIEAWKERAFPHLKAHLATKVDPVIAYLVLYHEAAVANLLEVTLFHLSACEAVGEEALLELADWCYRCAGRSC